VRKRQFTEKGEEEFKYLLCNEAWENIFLSDDVNTSFNAFMSMFTYYFKTIYVKDQYENTWITQGLKVYSKKMQFLNSLKRTKNLSRESLDYIKRYQIIYNRVIKEAKKRKND
jgi:hypothetical protein